MPLSSLGLRTLEAHKDCRVIGCCWLSAPDVGHLEPGPQKPLGLSLDVVGHDGTYFWGPGIANHHQFFPQVSPVNEIAETNGHNFEGHETWRSRVLVTGCTAVTIANCAARR